MKKLIPFFVLFLLLSGYILSSTPVNLVYADGESWLSDWSYRKSHEIAYAAGAGTDYQVKVLVHSDSGSDSGDDVYLDSQCTDFPNDIAFTDDDGDTELDHWLESTVGTLSTFWIEVADDLSSVNQTIYIYYGKNGQGSSSHLLNTWIWGTDFSATLNWLKEQGTGTWSIHDGILDIDASTSAGADFAVYSADYPDNTMAGRMLSRTRYTAKGSGDSGYKVGSGDGSRPSNAAVCPDTAGGNLRAWLEDAGYWDSLGAVAQTQDTWYLVEWRYMTDLFAGYVDDSLIGSINPSTEPVAASNDYAMIETYRCQIEVDWMVYGKYVSPEPANGDWGAEEAYVLTPMNNSLVITDMDDTDNLYAQIAGGYTIEYTGYDDNGYIDVDHIFLNFTQVTTVRISIKYTNSSDTFSVEDGGTWVSVDGASSSSRSGIWLNLTVIIHIKWGATDENDLELMAYIEDFGSLSDTDTMQTDYCDVVTDLSVSNFVINDARGDVSASLTISGNANYTNSAFYPPDAEFTNIQIYDQNDNVEATDVAIVNGFFSVTFTADATVKNETYNPYIDMADADYVDAEEGVYVWYVSDRYLITNVYANASHLDVGATVTVYVTGELEFDGHTVGGGAGDNTTMNSMNMTWDAGNTRWYVEDSEAIVTANNYDTCTGYEATYGVSVVNQDGKSVTVIWTGIIYRLLATPTQPYNFTSTFITLESMYYEQSGVNVTYTDFQVQRNGTNYLDVQKDKYLGDYNETIGTVYNYTISSVSETYGLTGLAELVPCIVEWISIPAGEGAAVLPEVLIVGFNETIGSLDVFIDLSFHDDTGLSHYVLSHNASGAWANMTWRVLAGTNDTANENVTLPVANTQFGVMVYCNNSAGDWATLTDVSFSTAPSGIVLPEVLVMGFNETVGGLELLVSLSFHDDTGLSHYVLSHNASGAWANMTWRSLAGTDDVSTETLTLPAASTQFGVTVYCNNTSGDWATLTDISFDTATLAEAGGGLPIGILIGAGFGFIIAVPLLVQRSRRMNENGYM